MFNGNCLVICFRKFDTFSQNFYINDGRSRSLFSESYDNGLDATEDSTYSSELAIKPRSYDDSMGGFKDMLAGRSYDSGQVFELPNSNFNE